uniref:Stomatin (EPB72)-like 3b n=1 Tax=Acanthochromis polyacanthus TaxID=80966 RepID=A0A3Q1EIZ1_9TELE
MEMENQMESQKRRGKSNDNLISDRTGALGCVGWTIVILSGLFTFLLFPLTIWFCFRVSQLRKPHSGLKSRNHYFLYCKCECELTVFVVLQIVQEYERAVIFRVGRIKDRKPKGPGVFFILPCTDSFVKVDLRTVSFDIPPQEILTKDSVTVSVDGVVYFRVSDPIASVANVSNADFSTRLLAQTTLRNVLGTKNLAELLSDREGIAHSMQSNLDEATDHWGIKVERVEIKDVKLPHQLQRAMAAEAEAAREARAKVIAAEGEMNASRALKEASLVIAESPSALQLRYLQTLNTIASEKNSTIIFPLPMDVMSHFMRK